MAEVVVEGIRNLQTIVGKHKQLYHMLQEFINCARYVKDTGIGRLPYFSTTNPLSALARKDDCILCVVVYLILEYWGYQQGERNMKNIEMTRVYIDCLCQVGYKELKVDGNVREGYYVWANPLTQLDKS